MGQASWSGAKAARLGLALALAAGLAATATARAEAEVAAAGREIATALRAGSAARLAATLPARGRVRAELPTLAPSASGLLSTTQCRYLFEDIFGRIRVTGFEVSGLTAEAGEDRAVLTGVLTARTGENGELALEMRLVLAREDGVWVLRELAERARRTP